MITITKKDINPIKWVIFNKVDRHLHSLVFSEVWDRVRVQTYIQFRRQIYDNNNQKEY